MADIRHKRARLKRRHYSIRHRVQGTSERPRLCVYRSLKHIYAQVIDDLAGRTLAAASTLSEPIKGTLKRAGNCEAAAKVGELIAARAKEAGVKAVCFDRG